MPKLSVIVPVYNSEEEIRDCLDSLVEQTEQDIEIIIIDDKSIDNSLEIVKSYGRKYPNIRIYQNEQNLGQGETRNRGIEIATGDYIAFLDSDDYINPGMYQELLQAAEKYNNPELITTGVVFVKTSGYRQENFSEMAKGVPKVVHPKVEKEEIFNESPSLCNKIFRKDTVKGYKILDCMFEDAAFSFTRFLEADTVVEVPTHNYFYRRDITSGVSAQNFQDNGHIDEIFRVADEIGDELQRKGLYDYFESEIRRLQIAICLQRVDEIDYWQATQERKNEVKAHMFETIYHRYGSLEGLDDIPVQCKAGFKVVDEYNDFTTKEAKKSVRK